MARLYSVNPVCLYRSVIRYGINDWRIPVARKLISYEVDSISPDDQSLPGLLISLQEESYV